MATCTFTVPDKNVTGDNFYGASICSQVLIDYFWNTYGFSGNSGYWDGGFGWEDPCNTSLPMGRTFNGCYLLTYSASDYSNDSYSGPMLNWARRYVRENIEDVRAKCGDGTAIATSFSGLFADDRVELYLGFFYSQDVLGRAETGPTRVGDTKAHGCTVRCICGGSTLPALGRLLRCASVLANAPISSSITPLRRILGLTSSRPLTA